MGSRYRGHRLHPRSRAEIDADGLSGDELELPPSVDDMMAALGFAAGEIDADDEGLAQPAYIYGEDDDNVITIPDMPPDIDLSGVLSLPQAWHLGNHHQQQHDFDGGGYDDGSSGFGGSSFI